MDNEVFGSIMGLICGGGFMYCVHLYIVRDLENSVYTAKLEGIQEGIEIGKKSKPKVKPKVNKKKKKRKR